MPPLPVTDVQCDGQWIPDEVMHTTEKPKIYLARSQPPSTPFCKASKALRGNPCDSAVSAASSAPAVDEGPHPQSYVESRVKQSNSGLPRRSLTILWTWHNQRDADLRDDVCTLAELPDSEIGSLPGEDIV